MLLATRWRGVEKLIFVFRENYESELAFLESALLPGKTFVDVGANSGIYALAASRIVGPSGRVIAFEPSLQSFPTLKTNILLNGVTNVLAIRAAVSNKTGKALLYHGPDPSQNTLGVNPFVERDMEEVVTESLDNALCQASTKCVDVIKMDVEGAEELVIRGANRVVTSQRPIIIFEINPDASASLGLSPHGAWDLLDGLGYEFYVAGPSGLLREATSPPAYRNVVAIPRKQERSSCGLSADRPVNRKNSRTHPTPAGDVRGSERGVRGAFSRRITESGQADSPENAGSEDRSFPTLRWQPSNASQTAGCRRGNGNRWRIPAFVRKICRSCDG